MSAKETLQYIGKSAKLTLKTIAVWTVTIAPIMTIMAIWIMGFLQVLGIDIIAVLGVDRRFEAYLRIVFVAISIVLLPGLIVAAKLTENDPVKLRAKDAKTGNGGDWEIPKEKWKSLTVENFFGEEVGKSALHEVDLEDGMGYEADQYDPDRNVAITSDYAGYSPTDIRHREEHDEHVIDDIRTTMYRAWNAAWDTIAQQDRLAREAGMAEVNEAIRRREKGTLQTESTPSSPFQDYIEDRYEKDETVQGNIGDADEESRDVPEAFEDLAESEDLPTGGDDE